MFGVSSVSYVAISGQVMDKVVNEARNRPDEQVVGVLVGGQSGDAIIVEDAVTGPAESDSTHATLPGDSIARIADDIINKRVRGNIVGWYHSHVRGGVFMSETDVETQLKLQQFSPLVAAMVIDTHTGKSGFFRADAKTKGSSPVRSEVVTGGMPPPFAPPSTPGAYYPQAPPSRPPTPVPVRTILIAVVLIALAVTAGIVALVVTRPATAGAGNLAIAHNPPNGPFTIAYPIRFDANVTGTNLSNVTLAYRIIQQNPAGGFIVGDLVKAGMGLKAAGTDSYFYEMPASEVAGLYINYYISAFDASNNVARTDVYNLDIGDFDWELDRTDEIVVVRTISTQVPVKLVSINGFSRPVKITVIGSPPAGVSIRATNPNVVPPGPAVLQITSTSQAEISRRYEVTVEADYTPPNAPAVHITRDITLVLTVTDFDFTISPSYVEVKRDKEATYILKLIVFDGLTAPNGFKISVTGLPEKTSWKLVLFDYKITSEEKAEVTFYLVISVESGASTGLYLFDVRITVTTGGGSISRSVTNIQVKII